MKEIKVVIGKNFGDEGKGQTVSDLCRGASALVVRHNGGAQSGHTVEEGEFRFVFHQIGSGSLWGAPTYWSHTFLPDLLKLGEETREFERAAEAVERKAVKSMSAEGQGKGDSPLIIYAHPECACTIVYDVLLNSLVEILRGEKKHGSCGMGIYEAVLRSRREEYRLCLTEFAPSAENPISLGERTKRIVDKLKYIRQEYVAKRLEKLLEEFSVPSGLTCGDGLSRDSKHLTDRARQTQHEREREIQDWIGLIWDDNVLYNTAEEMCENFDRYVRLADIKELWQQYDRIVFENGQGLLLDEDNQEYYPHLTPSHTGLHNIVAMLRELSMEQPQEILEGLTQNQQGVLMDRRHTEALPMEIIYVTRTYVTRHGAGRLDCECDKEDICPAMEDKTNVPNLWQDSLRYAKHSSVEGFFRPISQDLRLLQENGIGDRFAVGVAIRLTHLDETDGKILFADGEKTVQELRALIPNFLDGSLALRILQ